MTLCREDPRPLDDRPPASAPLMPPNLEKLIARILVPLGERRPPDEPDPLRWCGESTESANCDGDDNAMDMALAPPAELLDM